jgi:SRSO17 transposase
MVGQFSELERKSIEPIALNVKGGKVRAMQRFISDAEWDDQRIESRYRRLINEDLGSPDGAIIFDETGFVKKGNDSIGVAKQYCGSVGKVENCQTGVFAAYVSPYGYALMDKRLYIPEKWFSENFREKREKCQLPEEVQFQTKPQLAAEMLSAIAKEQSVPFRYVLADSIYSSHPRFVETVEGLVDITYFLSINSDTRCWLRHPVTIKKTYTYRGKTRRKRVLAADQKNPITVKELAQNIHNYFWYRRTVSEGTKGPITYEFTKRRVVLCNHGLPQKTVWLIIKRTLGKDPEYSYYVSNAPASTRLKTFVWLSGLRWAIEQCFEETKTELGLDHYEVRKYKGWHHHVLVCMLAHFFLWHLKIRLGKKSTVHYGVPAAGTA